MKCQRKCLSGEEAGCRVRSEVIDMKVCAVCADEARRLRLTVEASVTEEEEAPEIRESARSGIIFCLSARGEGAEASISVILSCWIFSIGQKPMNSLGIGTE